VIESCSLLNAVGAEVDVGLGEFDGAGPDAVGVLFAIGLLAGAHAAEDPTTITASAIAEIIRPGVDTNSSLSAACRRQN
jgi:hypothetical protein